MHKTLAAVPSSETTTFLLKTLLLSFWAGVDIIAVLIMSTFPIDDLLQHRIPVIAVLALLISGTVFSALFVWAANPPKGAPSGVSGVGKIVVALHSLRREPRHLTCAGLAVVSLLLILSASGLAHLKVNNDAALQIGRADRTIAKKCAEVANLEKKLFQSDVQFVIAQCLVQYDEQYASLREPVRLAQRSSQAQ